MIKAVIFDCYGVMVEDGWLAFLHKYGGGPNDEQLYYYNRMQDLGQMGKSEFIEHVSHLTNVEPVEAERIIRAKHSVNQDLVSLIEQLSQNYKIGMISNAGGDIRRIFSDKVVKLFDDFTMSYQVGALKPQPEIYQHALDKLGVEASEAVFIDDRLYNCEGAEKLGMTAFVYENPKQTIEQLRKLGVKTG